MHRSTHYLLCTYHVLTTYLLWPYQVLRVEEFIDGDLEPDAERDGVHGLDRGRVVDAAAHDDVELALPSREEVGAARVVHRRLERRVVKAVVRQGRHLVGVITR